MFAREILEALKNSNHEINDGPTEADIRYEEYKNFLRNLVKKYKLTRNSFFVKYDLKLPDPTFNRDKNINKKIFKIINHLKKHYPNHKKRAVLFKLLAIRCQDALTYPLEIYDEIHEKIHKTYEIHVSEDDEMVQVELLNKKLENIYKKAQFANTLKLEIKEFIKLIDDEFNIELPDNNHGPFFGHIEDELE